MIIGTRRRMCDNSNIFVFNENNEVDDSSNCVVIEMAKSYLSTLVHKLWNLRSHGKGTKFLFFCENQTQNLVVYVASEGLR